MATTKPVRVKTWAVMVGLDECSQGGWTAATLYAAILREIGKKGDASRFVKTDRGKFALRA